MEEIGETLKVGMEKREDWGWGGRKYNMESRYEDKS